jgi:membrane fusion protein (multidrug efflux system)
VRLIVLAVLISSGLVAAGCSDEGTDQGKGSDSPGRGGPAGGAPIVEIAQALVQPLHDTIEALGTVTANESVTITAKLTDTVSQVRFEDGDLVEAGEVLVELTNREETALLAEAEANVVDARAQHRRLADLFKDGSVPESQVDEARARLLAAQARHESIMARLADRLIRAPFSGVTGFRQVSAGALLSPSTPITTLDDIATIKLDFTVPELLLADLAPGLAVSAVSAALGNRAFAGTVRTIGSRIDPVTRAVKVRALIDNPDLLLRPGMLLTVRLRSRSREALVIPDAALIQEGTTMSVFVVTDGKATRRKIHVGQRSDDLAEVLDGLAAGDAVVTAGQLKLRDGMPVQQKPAHPAPVTAAPEEKG